MEFQVMGQALKSRLWYPILYLFNANFNNIVEIYKSLSDVENRISNFKTTQHQLHKSNIHKIKFALQTNISNTKIGKNRNNLYFLNFSKFQNFAFANAIHLLKNFDCIKCENITKRDDSSNSLNFSQNSP